MAKAIAFAMRCRFRILAGCFGHPAGMRKPHRVAKAPAFARQAAIPYPGSRATIPSGTR